MSPAEVAKMVAEMARDRRFTEVGDLFAPPLRAAVSTEALRVAWAAEIGKSGAVRDIGEPVAEPAKAGLVRVSVPVTCEHGGLTVIMSVDDSGKLHGLRLAPLVTASWTPPPYAAPKRFAEREIVLDSGVPGTLTLPKGFGRRPGVVLLSGGGPFDRDETSGPNKPLKDLAWGLASRRVAVLRFDKVAVAPGSTMSDEYVPHAVAAVKLLQQQRKIDAGRVFVVGHSMGGKVAPRVAAAEPSVAGLVILAGDTQPMHHAAVRVMRYLATVNPGPAGDAAVEEMVKQAAAVENLDASAELPFGLPASYWLDLRSYDPVATAASLGKPMLILQGGRDYQVTVEDDLAGWKAGLADRPEVSIRVYDADNHLFFPGAGPSTPAEYEAPQHVDPAVVTDIAAGLLTSLSAWPGARCVRSGVSARWGSRPPGSVH
jgi:dienelactone hydrolase